MPPTAAKHSYGTVLKHGNTVIAEVTKVNGANIKQDQVEATHLNSPNRSKEFIAGLIEAGEVSIELNWQPNESTHKELTTSLYGTTYDNWSIVWSDGTTWGPGLAKVDSMSPVAEVKERLTATATLKLSGYWAVPA